MTSKSPKVSPRNRSPLICEPGIDTNRVNASAKRRRLLRDDNDNAACHQRRPLLPGELRD